ncbi:MAG: acyl-CoA dehydrogenase family protein [Candidatus Rokubacteria bacterium]|nr:acyl-CoA dehydrogenase family protein [Candidatus Rokubacteria bacterium]
MDFDLPDEIEQLRRTVRKFVDEAVIPIEHAIDRDNAVPGSILREAARLGLFGITIPEEYGGSGLGALARCVVHKELARGGLGSICSIVGAHTGIGTIGIVRTGSRFVKEKYLPALATGDAIAAYAITEPNTGSDVAGVETRAERRGDRFLINGLKHFITNGDIANVITVIARTGRANAGKRHVSAFLVERGFPGFRVARTQDTMGLRGSHIAELTFEDCEVPDTNLLGEEGQGLAGALGALSEGRIGIAGRCVGAMERLLDLSIAYAKQRVQFGRPIAEFQAVRHMLADASLDVDTARLLTYETAWRLDRGHDVRAQASKTKLFASEAFGRVADRAVQIHGGYGYVSEFGIEKFYRDARITRIYEGTSEIQRDIIAKALLTG